jgi:dCTP deaminase
MILLPCHEKYKMHGMSGGLGAASYDVCVAEDFWMWPGRFKLASTIEKFDMPFDVCGVVHDKSTWVRRGLTVQNTFLDPGWKGFLTLELVLHRFRFYRIRKGTPIAQIVFHDLDKPTETPYEGKYQNQGRGPQEPRD